MAVVAMMGFIGIVSMDSAYAELIQGQNIRANTPYGCLLYDVDTPNEQNKITVTFSAYTRHSDISAVIQMDGKTMSAQGIKQDQQTHISKTFSMSEQNSHSLGICLQKSWKGTDERMLDITNVKWKLDTVDHPKTAPSGKSMSEKFEEEYAKNIPNTSEKQYDCTPKGVTSDSVHNNEYLAFSDKSFRLTIDNPHPNVCQYDVRIYNYEKNQSVQVRHSNVVSQLTSQISENDLKYDEFWGYTHYWLSVRSIDNSFFKFYPVILDNPHQYQHEKKQTPKAGGSSSENSKSNIDPTIILIIIAVAGIAIIAVGLSKRKKGIAKPKPITKPKPKPKPKETEVIDVHEFVKKCEGGTQEDMFTIMKRKYSDEEYRKILLKLLGDLNKINADNGIKMIVFAELATIPEQPKISKIPNRPDAPRLANASTTKQPLRIIVTWTEPNDGGSEIISYDVCRSKTGKSKEFSLLGIQGKDKFLQRRTDFIDIVPTEGTWYYQIVAHNSIGASPPSLAASITVGSSSSGGSGSSGSSGGSGGSGVTGYTKEQREAYNTLGISPGASDSEIKTAHQKLIIKYHPDKAKSDSQRKKFTAISTNVNLARSILLKK